MNGFGGLYLSELSRFVSRRFFRALAVVMVGVVAAVAVISFLSASDDAPDESFARDQIARCEQEGDAAVQRGEIADRSQWFCPSVEEILAGEDRRFHYRDAMEEAFPALGVMSLVVGLVAGASFLGAEFSSGSMTVLLTWEPRRRRVFVAKLLAALTIVSATVIVMLTLITLVFYPVALLRGTTEGATRSFWWSQLGTASRDLGLALFGTTFGAALATLVRNTAGAVGIGFFYGAVVDNVLGFWRDGLVREWLLNHNIAALLVPEETFRRTPEEGLTVLRQASSLRAAILLACYALLIALISSVVFRRRDVT